MVDIVMPSDEVQSLGHNTFARTDSTANDDVALLDSTNVSEEPDKEKKEKTMAMSVKEVERLITYLNDASDMLSRQLDELHYMERHNAKPSFQSNRCIKVKVICSKILSKFTGAKGISATIILQLVCLIMLTLVDNLPQTDDDKHKALQFGSIGMLVLQTINLVIVIIISMQLLNQIQKREVNRILLVQSYIATVLVFSGIYTASYRMDERSWKFISDPDDKSSPVMIVMLYTRFLFFSVSTATLCGSADAQPKYWYTSLFVSGQMLLSFMYFTSVLGTTLSKRRRPTPKMLLTKELMRFPNCIERERSKNDIEVRE